MSHWFDDFTKNLASAGSVPRRSFLQLVAAAAGTKLLEGIPLAGLVAGLPNRAFAAPGECTQQRIGTVVSREISLSRGGLSLHQLLSYDIAQQTGTLSATITKGGALLVKVDATAKKGGSVTSTTNYGPDVHGAKNVTMRSSDGKSFEGVVDGRVFTIRDRQIKFADGQPAPKIVLDPNVITLINDLLAEARKSLAACPAPRTPPVPRRVGFPAAPGQDWYVPKDEAFGSCQECMNDCTEDYEDAVTDWKCYFHVTDCYIAAAAEWTVCMALCEAPGGGCLPNPCGDFTTCAEGDQCFDFKDGKLCCPAPAALCQNVCCGKDRTSCAPDGTCGCRSDETTCGNQCCNDKQECSSGICCPEGQTNHEGKCCRTENICGGICCDELSKCVDPKTGLCCLFTAEVCGGKCCQPGEQCINEKCCSKPCGKVCCGAGQACKDGKCLSIPCRGDQVTCVTQEDPDQKGPLIAMPKAICCPPKVACCSGKCCKPGEICCSTSTGVPFGCHDPQLCVA